MNLRKIKPFWLVIFAFVVATFSSALHSWLVYWIYRSYFVSVSSPMPPVESIVSRQLVYGMRFFVPLTVLTWILVAVWNRGQYSLAKFLGGITGSALLVYSSWLLLLPGRTVQSLALGAFIVFTTPQMCWALLLLAFGLFAHNPRSLTPPASVTSITKEEFEIEARRVFKAFGLEVPDKIDIGSSANKDQESISTSIKGSFSGKPLCLYLLYHFNLEEKPPQKRVTIMAKRCSITPKSFREGSSFNHSSSGQSLHYQKTPSRKTPTPNDIFMLRGLLNLGYDIDPLCEQLGITVTAHEKMEWILERREEQRNSHDERAI